MASSSELVSEMILKSISWIFALLPAQNGLAISVEPWPLV